MWTVGRETTRNPILSVWIRFFLHLASPVRVITVAVLALASNLSAQGVSGTVTNESARPVEQAQVVLDPGAGQREVRTDRDGAFRFVGVAPGTHRLRVMRIGFQPRYTTVAVAGDSTTIRIALVRLTSLSEVAVLARPTGVYGTVLERDSLRAIPGARVELLGARESDTTDASGAFAMGNARAGTFMLKVTHPMYDVRILSVRVPRDSGVGVDVVLRAGSAALANHMEGLWVDMAQRINWKGVNAAVVGRDELAGHGNSLDMAIKFAPSFAKPGLVIDERACVFVDGMPRPGGSIRDFAVDEIESVEAYGARGELTGTLMKRWPRGVPCGNPEIRPVAGNRAQVVSIWLRR